jgi:hypothetical protein
MPSRDGDLLRVIYNERLPSCCVWCARPALNHVRKTFYWHSQWLYLMLLVGILPYLIIALFARQKMELQVPLCDRCFAGWRKRRWIAAVLLLGSIPLGIVVGVLGNAAGLALGGPAGGLIAFLMFAIGLILLNENLLIPTHIDGTVGFGTFKGASPNFLKLLSTNDE